MRHESMMQAYRLLVPYVFTADKDDPHVLIAQDRNYEDMLHAKIRFKRNPENFLDVWHIIQRHPAWPPSFSRKALCAQARYRGMESRTCATNRMGPFRHDHS